jgi:hypothetical protein
VVTVQDLPRSVPEVIADNVGVVFRQMREVAYGGVEVVTLFVGGVMALTPLVVQMIPTTHRPFTELEFVTTMTVGSGLLIAIGVLKLAWSISAGRRGERVAVSTIASMKASADSAIESGQKDPFGPPPQKSPTTSFTSG